MKFAVIVLAVAAAIVVAGCASQTGTGPGVQTSGSNNNGNSVPPGTVFCGGLSIDLSSPSTNERVNGGFRAVWTLKNQGGPDYTNRNESFTISMKPAGGTYSVVKTVKGYYGDSFNQDVVFLSKVNPGSYFVSVAGTMSDCAIPAIEVPITVA